MINRGGEAEDTEPYCHACDNWGHEEDQCPNSDPRMPGVFHGVARVPANVKWSSTAGRVIAKCQEIEDILAQVIDGDMTVAEARGRYLTIEP
jgi:hypothetical protein